MFYRMKLSGNGYDTFYGWALIFPLYGDDENDYDDEN